MGIETKYEYKYYTVLHQDWFDEAQRILTTDLTTEILINVIERKLKNNNDWTLNNLKVDYSQRSEDIEYWITKNVQHKDRPVFIQLEDDQPIITSGSGTLFVFYEDNKDDDEISTSSPDGHYYYGSIDGLAGAGGRI